MRLALISANLFDIGGVENHIRFMARELAALGHELMLFKPTWHDDLQRAEALDLGLPTTVIDLGVKPYEQRYLTPLSRFAYAHGFMKRAAFSLRARLVERAVSSWRPEMVWQHDLSSSWLACRRLSQQLPVVLTNHTGEYLLLNKLPGSKQLLHRLMRHYASVIGPSAELTPSFRDRAYTIHNGVDLEYFSPVSGSARDALRERLLGPDGRSRFVVFCPRRWAPTKGVLFLARALARLVSNGDKDVLVIFAGSDYALYPDYAREVRSVIRGLERHYMEVGDLDLEEMRDWYRAADLVVIPSLMEAVSLAALEAMGCGAPVLSTNVGGMPELIEHERTGLLVRASDEDDLARAISRAMREPQLLADIQRRASSLVHAKYSWSAIAAQTADVLANSLPA